MQLSAHGPVRQGAKGTSEEWRGTLPRAILDRQPTRATPQQSARHDQERGEDAGAARRRAADARQPLGSAGERDGPAGVRAPRPPRERRSRRRPLARRVPRVRPRDVRRVPDHDGLAVVGPREPGREQVRAVPVGHQHDDARVGVGADVLVVGQAVDLRVRPDRALERHHRPNGRVGALLPVVGVAPREVLQPRQAERRVGEHRLAARRGGGDRQQDGGHDERACARSHGRQHNHLGARSRIVASAAAAAGAARSGCSGGTRATATAAGSTPRASG
jgi:hypothetical protein